MNSDWGLFPTKKSPIREFKHLSELWDATLEPLKFRVEFQTKMISDYRHEFTRILQATPISWHSHASDVWAIIPTVIALLEVISPARSRKLSEVQKKRCRIATFESQMPSYYGPMV
jgi:hypothetical protein